MCNRRLLLIEHHRAEKMHWRIPPSVEMLYEFTGYIFPKRLPLLVPTPDVLALEERHFEAHLLFKDREQGNGVSIHFLA